MPKNKTHPKNVQAKLTRAMQELALINSIQEALSRNADIRDIYKLVGDHLRKIFNSFTTVIGIFDHKDGQDIDAYFHEDGKYLPLERNPISNTRQYLIKTQKTLTFNTTKEFVDVFGAKVIGDSVPTASGVFVPLVMNGSVWGYITLQDMNEYSYNESDVHFLESLASSLNVALANARLLEDIRQRNAEMVMINSIQTALSSQLDMQSIYELVGSKIQDIFDHSDVSIRIFDPENDMVHFPYTIEEGEPITIESVPMTDKGVAAHVFKTGKTLLINEDMEKVHGKMGSYILHGTTLEKSALYVPLMAGKQMHGLLELVDMQYEHAFSESDVRLLETLANSMSVALENARLFDETQRLLKDTEAKARRSAALFRLSAELADTFDETEICQRVVDGLQDEALGYQLITLLLVDEETGDRVASAVIGHSNLKAGERIPPGSGLSERPTLDGNIHYSPDVTTEENYFEGLAGSEIDVPLKSGDKIIGVLVVESKGKDAFADEDFGVLTASANQAALAIERARLYSEAQQQLDELALLNRVITATTSAQDSNSVLSIVCRELAETLNAPQVAAAVFNDEHTSLSIVAEYLMKGSSSAIGHRIPVAGNLSTLYVLKHKSPLAIEDVQNDPRMASIKHLMVERGTTSMLILPLLARDEIIGTIGLDFLERHKFTENEIALAFNVARSTAQSLASARLFEQTNAALAELQRVEESQRAAYDELDRYLPQKIRDAIEITYYAKVNERGMLDQAINDPTFQKDPLNHMALYSDHGVVHVRDVARTILGVLDTVNGVLIPHRERKVLEFMKGYGVMLAYNHDIGMVDFSSKGRAMHPEFAAKRVFDESYDEIVDTIWNENWGNVAWRLINFVEQGTYQGDPKIMLRELLAMSIGHSKSKVPMEVLNDPFTMRDVMLKAISTEINHLYFEQQIKKAEAKLEESKKNKIKEEISLAKSQLAELQNAYNKLSNNGNSPAENLTSRFYTDFENDAFTWLTSDQPALQLLTQDVIDTIRTLRVADALRQRGSTLKTSGNYPIFIDQNTANAVIALQKGSGETLMFEVDKTHSVGEANLASSEVTLEGNLRLSFQRGSFRSENAERRAAYSCAMIVEDIQLDTIHSFRRPTQPSTQRKNSEDIQILIEETDDSLKFSAMVLEELTALDPQLGQRSRIVPSLTNVSDEERKRYLTGIELQKDSDLLQEIIEQITKHGGKTGHLSDDAAFTDVRLIELREGEVLLEIGSPPGFVYLPMGEGLVTLSLGGYQPQNAPPWVLLGNSRVIRGAVQESRVTAEKNVQLLMIPKAIYLRYWHDTYEVNELMNALNQLYTKE